MEEFINIFSDANSSLFITFFIKAFAILFSVLFLLYAIVIARQTQEMNKTVTTKNAPILYSVALLHIILALILIFASIVLI